MNENGCSKCFCFAGYHLNSIDVRANPAEILNFLSDELVRCEATELQLSRIEIDFGTEINESWPLIEFSNHPNKLRDRNELDEDALDGLDGDLDSDLSGNLTGWPGSLDKRKGGGFRLLESARRKGYLEIVSEEFFNDQTFYWLLDRRFLGNRFDSYDHKLTLKLLYSILRGDVSETTFKYFKHWPDLILLASTIGDRTIAIGYKGFDYEGGLESDRVVQIEITLNERNWFQLDAAYQLTDQPIDAALFRLALMRVDHFLLRAKYHTDQIESRLYLVRLEQSSVPSEARSQVQLSNQPTAIGRWVAGENCASFCPQPFAGPHCEQCERGHYMVVHFKNKLARKFKRDFLLECKTCDCNGQPCDQRGKCLCANSTQGDRCERCNVGYFGNPLQGIQCKQCSGQQSPYCSPCADGHHLPGGLDYNLAIFNGNLPDADSTNTANATPPTASGAVVSSSVDPTASNLKISSEFRAYRAKCVPCGCSKRGSFNETCDQFTGQCHCKENHSGSKCDRCRPGFRQTPGGCLAEDCWQSEPSPHNVCIARLANVMNEFDSEHKFRLADLNAIRRRPLTTLSGLEAKHHELNNSYSQFWPNNLAKSLADSNVIFESLNEQWKSNKREFDSLMARLSVDGAISETLLEGSGLAFEGLIAFRDEITWQLNKLISLKYQRLFDSDEIQKFYRDEAVLLRRLKKELNEDQFSERMKASKKLEVDLSGLYQNVSSLAKKMILKKEEIIEQFDRLFKLEGELAKQRDYIESKLEPAIDLVSKLVKNLNYLLATVERLKRDADDESVQIEQTIVDAHYINNVTASIANKLALGFFDFEAKIGRFVQTLNGDLHENFVRLNAENEVKYTHICEMHLLDLRQEVAILERSLNNSGLLSEHQRSDFILNQTKLINRVQLDLNQFKEIDLCLDALDLENELTKLKLPSDFKRTNEELENKSSHLTGQTSENNANLNDIATRLEVNKIRMETLNNNTFIIHEMGGNVKIRNDLLMEIEQGLNNLTRKIYLSKYMDNSYFISPAIEIKTFEHDLTLSHLNKELLPDYLKRLAALKQETTVESRVNSTVDEQLYHINSSIQMKKKCLDSFQLRNKKIELLNYQTKQLKMKVDNQIQHAKQLLSNLNLGLTMNDNGESRRCERTISLDSLEPVSHLEIEFLYSFADSTNQNQSANRTTSEEPHNSQSMKETREENHTILVIGSIDRQFVLFELERGQIKVSWKFGSSSDQLKSLLELSENDEHFKRKDAYYQIQFACIAQKASLVVSRVLEKDAKSIVTKYTGDLIMNLDKRLHLGHFADGHPKKLSSDDRQPMNEFSYDSAKRFRAAITDLSINGESIGLWNFESTSDFCAPLKAIALDERTAEVHLFNGRDSYLKLDQINRYDARKYTIRMQFRTFSADGLLLATFNEISRDLIAVEIKNGHLRLAISTKRLQLALATKNQYNTGAWYTVIVEREDHLAMITTDEEQLEGYLKRKNLTRSNDLENLDGFPNFNQLNEPEHSNNSNNLSDNPPDHSEAVELDLQGSPIFVGGLPIDQRVGLLDFAPFYGCVRQIQIETTLINLNGQNSFGLHGSGAANPNLIKQMSFDADKSSIKFNNLSLRNWTNFGFSFRTRLSNCSILSIAEDQTVGGERIFFLILLQFSKFQFEIFRSLPTKFAICLTVFIQF